MAGMAEDGWEERSREGPSSACRARSREGRWME